MVLSNWKKELLERRHTTNWGRGLENRDFWNLVNFVVDKITLPSCVVYVGCHDSDPETPMCWAALRRIPGLQANEIVFMYARKLVRKDAELAAVLETSFVNSMSHFLPLATERRPFNPFSELKESPR